MEASVFHVICQNGLAVYALCSAQIMEGKERIQWTFRQRMDKIKHNAAIYHGNIAADGFL